MSGVKRLSVFAAILWLAFWLVAYLVDVADGSSFNWSGFALFGVSPPAVALGVPWGTWWVGGRIPH